MASQGIHFILTPVFTSLSASSGLAGEVIGSHGLNFPDADGANVVLFNGTQAAVVACTTTTLDVTVPGSGSTGPVTLSIPE